MLNGSYDGLQPQPSIRGQHARANVQGEPVQEPQIEESENLELDTGSRPGVTEAPDAILEYTNSVGQRRGHDADETARIVSRIERTDWGFWQLCKTPLRTLSVDRFEVFVDNPQEWDRLVDRMDKYFRDAINILLPATVPLSRPPRFHVLQRKSIKNRFPGGQKRGEPGDGDLRDVIMALRRIVTHNLVHYYILKRLFIELPPALSVIFAFVFMKDDLGVFGLWIGVTIALYYIANKHLYKCLLGALNESCLFVGSQGGLRTQQLKNRVDDIYLKIETDRFKLTEADQLKEWPNRSKKWAKVLFWLAMRLEYVERFVAIETWVMRRRHYWLNRGALTMFVLTTIGFIAGMTWVGWSNFLEVHKAVDVIAYIVAFAAGLGMLMFSYFHWNTPTTFLEENLQTENWTRYPDLELDEKIADQIFRDKQAILDRDEQLRRRN